MTDSLTYRLHDGVATLALDDGKANAVTHDVIDGLRAGFDRAAEEAGALLIVGREGRFSAGFDLKVMTGSTEGMRALTKAGAEMLMHLYSLPVPTVAACTGHALAGGALLLLACDVRIGADVDARIGLNEVAIGMALPTFAVELARDRLATGHFTRATALAEVYSPAGAVEAGFLDRVVASDAVVPAATEEAVRLAAMATPAIGTTKRLARKATAERVFATLDDEMARLRGPDAG